MNYVMQTNWIYFKFKNINRLVEQEIYIFLKNKKVSDSID